MLPHKSHCVSMAIAILLVAAANSLPQHMLGPRASSSSATTLSCADALGQQAFRDDVGSASAGPRPEVSLCSTTSAPARGKGQTIQKTKGKESIESQSFGRSPPLLYRSEALANHIGTRNTIGDTIDTLFSAKHVASLLLAALLAVTAPVPAMADATIPSDVATLVQSSPLVVLALEAPYTGQLVDTSSANLVKLNSGVTYNDLREGTGEGIATEGRRVNIQWVLKRSNGYSIDSSAQNDGVPFIFVVGTGTGTGAPRAIPGLDEGIRGMRVGGIRRIVIPPSLAYVGGLGDDSPGPVPPGFGPKQRIKRVMENRMDVPDESFLLDVKLTRVQ